MAEHIGKNFDGALVEGKKNRNTNHPHTGSRSNRIKKLHKTSFGGANLCTIDTSETVFRSQRNSIKRQRKDNIIFDLFAHTYILYACVCNYRIHPKRHWFSSSSTNFCMLYRVYTTHNSLARFFDLRIPTQMQKLAVLLRATIRLGGRVLTKSVFSVGTICRFDRQYLKYRNVVNTYATISHTKRMAICNL